MGNYIFSKGRWRGNSQTDTLPPAALTFLSRRLDTDTGIVSYYDGTDWIRSGTHDVGANYIQIAEIAVPTAPTAANKYRLFVNSTTGLLSQIDSDSTIVSMGGGSSGAAASGSILPYSVVISKPSTNYIATETQTGTVVSTNSNGLTVVNTAITYANGLTNGGSVVIAPNTTVTLSASPIIMLSNVHLRGSDMSSKITCSGAFNAIDMKGANSGSKKIKMKVSNLVIAGTSVLGTQTRGNGISIDFADYCEISNCEISGFGGNTGGSDDGGISIRRSTKIDVLNNYCHDNINGIILGTTNSPVVYEAVDCKVIGNKTTTNFNDGIHGQISKGILYANNYSSGNLESGIDLLGEEGDVLVGNECTLNTHSGIEVGNSLTATGNPDRFHTITGNVCTDNTLDGIQFLGLAEDCEVSSNNLSRNVRDGLRLAGGTTSGVNRNSIINNLLRSNGGRGIYLVNQGVDLNFIASNKVSNNSSRGIYLTSAGQGDPTNNVLRNNHVHNNTTSDTTDNVTSSTNKIDITYKTRQWMVTSYNSTTNGVRYNAWGGAVGSLPTESQIETTLESPMVLKRVKIRITTNSRDSGNQIISMRKNQADVSGTVHTVAFTATTSFDSGELTVPYVVGDEIAVKLDVGGTTGTLAAVITCEYEVTAVGS